MEPSSQLVTLEGNTYKRDSTSTSEDQTIFRNNPQKCVFNKFGFCKFRLECRKDHSKKVCENKECDEKCVDRHPKLCRNKEKCKFFKKNVVVHSVIIHLKSK